MSIGNAHASGDAKKISLPISTRLQWFQVLCMTNGEEHESSLIFAHSDFVAIMQTTPEATD
jgi:hypothetical protein